MTLKDGLLLIIALVDAVILSVVIIAFFDWIICGIARMTRRARK